MARAIQKTGQPRGAEARPLSRRRFMANCVAAGTAPFLAPASALGLGAPRAPSERITLGFIGLGQRGSSHLADFLPIEGTQVLAVCDPYRSKQETARKLVEDRYSDRKESYRGCETCSDFRELLARDDIDAVVVASPENWHAVHMASAVRAGKDVYGEKALTLTVEEGRRLCRTVRRYGRVLQVGTQQRSGRDFRFACELARNGYLGKLQTVKVGVPGGRSLPIAPPAPVPEGLDYELWLGPARWTPYNDLKCTFNWYFIQDYCAGWIQSWGVHHCDIALWGAPALGSGRIRVGGSATFPSDGLADTSITWKVGIETEEGLCLSFADNSQEGHEQGCRFVGTEGEVHVNRRGIRAKPESLLSVQLGPGDERLYESGDHRRNFLDCIRSRRDPVSPVEAGHAATTITLVSDIATRLGRELIWDWKTEGFVDDDAANRMLRRSLRSPWTL